MRLLSNSFTPADSDMSDFLTIFKTRRDYGRALLELSHGQSELILADDYGELLALLGRKQRILERMDEYGRRHARLWQRWSEQRDELDPETRRECEAVLADTERILGTLSRHEQSCTDDLARRRDATRLKLESLSQGVRAHAAYQEDRLQAGSHRLDVGQ